MDGDAILYGISRRPRSTRAAAGTTSREITPQLLGLLGGAVDEGVDRLAAHGPQTAFVSGFQPAPQFARASTLLRGGRERSSARLGLSRSPLHAACAIYKLRPREAPSNARWAADCATVRARSSTSDGGSPEQWRRSNGPGPSTNQSVLFRHPTNANSRARQHSLRSRSTCRYQIGGGCCTSRQNSGAQRRRSSGVGAPDGSEQDASARPPPAAVVLLSKLMEAVVANARGRDEGLRADKTIYRGARCGVLRRVSNGAETRCSAFRPASTTEAAASVRRWRDDYRSRGPDPM